MGDSKNYSIQIQSMTTQKRREPIQAGRGWLYTPVFRKVMWCLGGSHSYFFVETDPGQEWDCTQAFQATADPNRRREVLQPLLPENLPAALEALQRAFPPDNDDDRNKLIDKIMATRTAYRGSDDEFEAELQKRLKVFDWIRILKAVPADAKDTLAAWNRLERDAVYREIEIGEVIELLPATARWYINQNVRAIARQEDRWRNGVSMGWCERLLFWLWNVLMLLGVIIPDMINFALGALLAVVRSLPTRPQALVMAVAIYDFRFADERLARLTLFQRFLGALVTIIFGIKATFDPEFHSTAFRAFGNLWWKGLLAVSWQIAMQNWKNVLDIYIFSWMLIRRRRLSDAQVNLIKEKIEKLDICNAYDFAWFDTYDQGNRFRAQVSYHKQDQGDVVSALAWAARLKRHSIASDDLFSKFSTWVATTAIGILICASTFPVDAYAGLIALAYYGNIMLKMGLDVWEPPQSYDDLLRFFTATVGPTFPSTVVLIINLGWWIAKRTGLFQSVDYRFGITLAALFVASLYPRFWGEMFKKAGLWLRGRFAKRTRSADIESLASVRVP